MTVRNFDGHFYKTAREVVNTKIQEFVNRTRNLLTKKFRNLSSTNYSCEYIFCEEKQKVGLFVYHVEGLRVPQFENHWSNGTKQCNCQGLPTPWQHEAHFIFDTINENSFICELQMLLWMQYVIQNSNSKSTFLFHSSVADRKSCKGFCDFRFYRCCTGKKKRFCVVSIPPFHFNVMWNLTICMYCAWLFQENYLAFLCQPV